MDRRLNVTISDPSVDGPSPAAASIATTVARAADEYLDRLAAGETPDVEEFARRYPEVAGILPQVLPVLGLLRELAPPAPAPSELGEFHIIREIGRGGMGVVYEAEQVSLGRRVALKVLPAAGPDDARSLARFRVEARVMAALHHPHIVPIFAVGCDRGVHYYAMQLVEGCSLADRPREGGGRPSPREAARLAMQAALALEHAHGLGVLHRDIKPGNLLVEPGGHLWVTDFGLARWEGGGDCSASGDAPGTLRYMSPEQAAGGRVLDPRSDVYSLGATLYELLTGRPAFGGTDRADLLRRIANAEPVPPRRMDRAIPRDLETIVMTAMDKEPGHRYATARELADDLARFLDDRPIVARRPGPLDRLGRWSRRHGRATAAAAAVLVAALAASALGMARLWDEQRRTHLALIAAGEARRNEDQALRFTFHASDHIAGRALARIASDAAHDPAEAASDSRFCREALAYYEEIAARYGRDPGMAAIVAAAEHRIGFIRMILDRPGAEDAYGRSFALYRDALAASPRDSRLRSAMTLTYQDWIILLRKLGRTPEILEAFPRLLELRRGFARDEPGNAENLVSLALLQAEYAGLLAGAGRAGEAGIARREIEPIYRLADAGEPRNPDWRNRLAWMLVAPPGAAPPEAALAVELAERAVAITPADGRYWNTLGVAHYRAGEWPEAVDALGESMRLGAGGDPYDWLFLAMARWRLGDAAEARRWLERSLAWIEARAPLHPELTRFRDEAMRSIPTESPRNRGGDGRARR